MKWLPIVGLFLMFGVLLYLCAPAQSPKKPLELAAISLDQIWAFDMPGTHEIQELEPDKFGERTRTLPSAERSKLLDESLTFQIRKALKSPPNGVQANSGFAVLGTGAEALQEAYAVLVTNQTPRASFPAGSNVTVVFFSYLYGDYVHLERVERRGKTIEAGYQFVPHMTRDLSWHIALIPLGKLPTGEYDVQMTQLPLPNKYVIRDAKYVPNDIVNRIICRPFSFSVVERSSDE